MAGFRDVHLFPYSGWYRQPWGLPDTFSLDVDAAARTARRVTEAISRELTSLGVTSPVSSYRLHSWKGSSNDLELERVRAPQGPFLGRLFIPRGFRFLDPQVRATVLAEATEAALGGLAESTGWNTHAVSDAVQAVKDDDFTCAWVGPWKSTRDRKRRVRLQGRIHDDGYGRWRLVVAAKSADEPILETIDVLGWTWLANFDHAAKSMRFVSADVISVTSGSDMLPEPLQIDITTGKILRRKSNPRPITYPGKPRRVSARPQLQVRWFQPPTN